MKNKDYQKNEEVMDTTPSSRVQFASIGDDDGSNVWLVSAMNSAAGPTAAPQNVRLLYVENDTLLMRWDPPPKHHRNGVLLGYKVVTAP